MLHVLETLALFTYMISVVSMWLRTYPESIIRTGEHNSLAATDSFFNVASNVPGSAFLKMLALSLCFLVENCLTDRDSTGTHGHPLQVIYGHVVKYDPMMRCPDAGERASTQPYTTKCPGDRYSDFIRQAPRQYRQKKPASGWKNSPPPITFLGPQALLSENHRDLRVASRLGGM